MRDVGRWWVVRSPSLAVLELDLLRTGTPAGGVGVWVGVVALGGGAAEARWGDAFEEVAGRWHLDHRTS